MYINLRDISSREIKELDAQCNLWRIFQPGEFEISDILYLVPRIQSL